MPVLRTPYSAYDCGHFDDQYGISYPQHATLQDAYASSIMDSSFMMSSPGASTSTAPKKSHARRRPEGHIPRPRNAFIIFRSEFYSALKSTTSTEKKVYQQDMSVEVGKAWKTLSEEQKAPYYALQEQEKAQHMIKYPGYVCRPRKSPSPKAKRAPRKRTDAEVAECESLYRDISPASFAPSPSPVPSLCSSPSPSTPSSDFGDHLAAEDASPMAHPVFASWQTLDSDPSTSLLHYVPFVDFDAIAADVQIASESFGAQEYQPYFDFTGTAFDFESSSEQSSCYMDPASEIPQTFPTPLFDWTQLHHTYDSSFAS